MLRTLFIAVLFVIGAFSALRGAYYALLLYLWLAYFRPEQWVWGGLFAEQTFSLPVGVYLVLAALITGVQLRWNWITRLIIVFLFDALISAMLSYYPTALNFWVEFAKELVVSCLIVALLTDKRRFRGALLVIALSLSFEAAKQGWVQLLLNPGAKNANYHPLLGDENGVALGMFMLAPILIALSRTSTSKLEMWAYRCLTLGVIYRGVSTYSRGGFLTCGALIAMYIARGTQRIKAFMAVAVLAAVIVPVLPPAFWDRMSTITIDETQQDASTRSRLHFWSVAVEMAERNPFTGVGLNAFNQAYDDYDTSDGRFGFGRSVHSAWFGILAELGFPGIAFFVMILGLSLWSSTRAIKLAAVDPQNADLKEYGVALQTALVAFAVGGSFLPFQYNELLWHWFALSGALLALVYAAETTREPVAAAPAVRRYPLNVPATTRTAVNRLSS